MLCTWDLGFSFKVYFMHLYKRQVSEEVAGANKKDAPQDSAPDIVPAP